MTRPIETPPTSPEEEPVEVLLSAYLDGELDETTSRQVELLLARDPQARRLLQELEETWGMLDVLDRTDAEPSLTRTTLEMVALAAEEEQAKERREGPWRIGAQIALALAAVVGAAIAGFFWSAASQRATQERLLRDWPLLQHLDKYEQVGQWEFLRLLDNSGLFASREESPKNDSR